MLLRGFGAVTVGGTVADAVVRAWLLERGARAALDALSAGTPLAYTGGRGRGHYQETSAPARPGQLDTCLETA